MTLQGSTYQSETKIHALLPQVKLSVIILMTHFTVRDPEKLGKEMKLSESGRQTLGYGAPFVKSFIN